MHTPLSKDLEMDSWSSLATVTNFDAGPTQQMDDVDGSGVLLHDVQCFSSLSLLVESLIEQLCKLLETDGVRQKALYNIICNKLHKMKLIDQTYDIEELQFMRTHYQKALFHLLTVSQSASSIASSDTVKSSLLQLSTSYNLNLPRLHQQTWDFSHYHTEFEELEFIAKGGFGRVYRARNKIDRRDYAIKKICLRYSNASCFEQSLKEVHLLATLNHPNIVSYKSAWLEPYAPSIAREDVDHHEMSSILATRTRKRFRKRTKVIIDSVSDDDSDGIVFKDSKSGEGSLLSTISETMEEPSTLNLQSLFNESTEQVTTIFEGMDQHESIIYNEDSDSTESSSSSLEDKALCEFRGAGTSNQLENGWKFEKAIHYRQRELATLYIKMQLCESTLRQWLDKRNLRISTQAISIKESLATFRQIVQGVEYIHSKGIVHHDIKPSNIFVTSNLSSAQVGDFGLACLQHSAAGRVAFVRDRLSLATQHKGEVGTKMYAAPEQLDGKCNPKSDIFSLGIVLFELVLPFSTDMERCKVIGQLRSGHPLQELSTLSPKLIELIKHLIAPSPSDRPSARALLTQLDKLLIELASNDTASNKDEIIQQLLNIINEKDQEIEELKKQLEAARVITPDSQREPS